MFEKVNPSHPDKVADRIAGAIVDLAYTIDRDPKVAVEVMIGHGTCKVIVESSVCIQEEDVLKIVHRIAGDGIDLDYMCVKQDANLARNQEYGMRCGDNGIFCGMPVTEEQERLSIIAKMIYAIYPTDGKYLLDAENQRFIICQSNSKNSVLKELFPGARVNPLGDWTGGPDVDTGATNRKLGSDMGDAVTGGGLHGKDLSKADVSVNIYAHLLAQKMKRPVRLCCAIGDDMIDDVPYEEIVRQARDYINKIGGFERLAEWGLI